MYTKDDEQARTRHQQRTKQTHLDNAEFLKQLKDLYWGTIIIMSATVALSDHELVDPSAFCISFIILIFF